MIFKQERQDSNSEGLLDSQLFESDRKFRDQEPCSRKYFIPKGVQVSTCSKTKQSTKEINRILLEEDRSSDEEDNYCSCATTSTNQVSESNLFKGWCSCEDKAILQKLVSKRKQKKRDKMCIKAHRSAPLQMTSVSSIQNGQSITYGDAFHHHKDSSQYIEEYRLYNCLQYQGAKGDWVSVKDLANRYYSSIAKDKTKVAKKNLYRYTYSQLADL